MQKEMTEIHVAKHRNGIVDSFKLRFMKEFGQRGVVGKKLVLGKRYVWF